MTSDEQLVAQIALELLQLNAIVVAFGPLVLGNNDTELTLPATVVWAKFEEEQDGSPLAKRYALTIELRALRDQPPSAVVDSAFAAIDAALNPAVTPARPASLTAGSYYRIEEQNAGAMTLGEPVVRRRSYTVYAQLV